MKNRKRIEVVADVEEEMYVILDPLSMASVF